MDNAKAGKYLLEILTNGMYSNPLHIYREYIQNATDGIDEAVAAGLLSIEQAEIHIKLKSDCIVIRDNGCGVPIEKARTILLSLGDSQKNPDEARGFRGIGRISGLGYADKVTFVTSAYGDTKKVIMVCDGVKMRQLLNRSSGEAGDVMDAFRAISTFTDDDEKSDAHYFEVRIEGIIPAAKILLDEVVVSRYLSETAPVDFDGQKFVQGIEISSFCKDYGHRLSCYNIYKGDRKKPIYKLYSRSMNAGQRSKTKTTDYVRKIEYVYEEAEDGSPLYIGWIAITDFSGQLSDPSVQGIRLRKGNILVGNNKTFEKFFPSEGENANKMFAGEIHALHNGLRPNSQRDFFEPNEIYSQFFEKLQKWAGELNKKYRRGTSEATSAIRKLRELNEHQHDIHEQVSSGKITSDTKREQVAQELERIQKAREKELRTVNKAIEKGTIDEERAETVNELVSDTAKATKNAVTLSTQIAAADYATKRDLPTSYSREERRLYQRIIEVIDVFFTDDHDTAEKLREAIKEDLKVKKK